MKRVSSPKDIPTGSHFAVLVYTTTSIYIEGDKRSRTHPGHGYPAHTETTETFEHYVTVEQADLETFVMALEHPPAHMQKKPYAVLRVERRLETKTTMRVEIG